MKIGDNFPNVMLKCDGHQEIKIDDYRGKKIVLYFYPKDDTSGCTTEAKDFSQKISQFEKNNAVIIGVSPDTIEKHDKFKAKHDLKITLASDQNHEFAEKCGIWVEKSMYGRKYMGIERTTFLIDENGKIIQIWNKVKVPNHAQNVLEYIENNQ